MKNWKNKISTIVAISAGLLPPPFAFGKAPESPSLVDLESPACQDFVGFATKGVVDPQYPQYEKKVDGKEVGSSHLDPFKTDAIKVWVHNKPVYEWYDGIVTKDTPHILWSASKDVAVTLLARTIQEGMTYRGVPVTLDTPLELFFPDPSAAPEVTSDPVKLETFKAVYPKIKLRDLVQMSSGYVWNEAYDANIATSSFMPMLYLSGKKDMPAFALSKEISAQGPGAVWDYSGGNMNIVMAVLRKVYGKNYAEMPYKMLFDPLGMKGARFETDGSGNFVGSSYVYMTIDDMGAFGQLLLQNGQWNVEQNGRTQKRQLLPPDWTAQALTTADSVLSPLTTIDNIKGGGMEGRRVAWLNRTLYKDRQTGQRVAGFVNEEHTANASDYDIVYPQEMPQAPGDMYFAAGHYGQLIIVIPSKDMVIARTGYDDAYWADVQPLVVKALACTEPGYKPYPVKDLTPPSAGPKPGLFGTVKEIKDVAGDLTYLIQSGLGPAYISKEMCSFLFVMNTKDTITDPSQYYHTYLERSGLPSIAVPIIESIYQATVNKEDSSVTVSPKKLFLDLDQIGAIVVPNISHRAHLTADPHNGCLLD